MQRRLDFVTGEGPRQLSPRVPFTMAEICTNLTAFFFHTEQGCFSIYHHTCTYTPSVARKPPKVLDLFTRGTDAPLSPSPNTSVLIAVRNTTARFDSALGWRAPSRQTRRSRARLSRAGTLSSCPADSSHFLQFPGVY